MDDLIANGWAHATHILILHKPTGLSNQSNGETDKEAIQYKKAHITFAWVMVHNHHEFWIKEKALRLWIAQFLPQFSPVIFTPDQLRHMTHWVC